MPKQPSFTQSELLEKSLQHFWANGFHATSMDQLVKATSVSRHGIYAAFANKKSLFLACFDEYQDTIVTPAFEQVECNNSNLSSVARYFEFQISKAEAIGLPGMGCFVANSATEVAPHDRDTMEKIAQHNGRLHKGFENAIYNECAQIRLLAPSETSNFAALFVTFTNGLWSMSRTTTDAGKLRSMVRLFLKTMSEELK